VGNCGCHAQVDGVDSTGNPALSGSAPIVVDATPPAASITNGPANPTNQDTPFAFAATDPVVNGVASGVDHLECSLDGAAFAPCQSGISYPGLAEGAHTFQVRPIDKAGNIGAPAKWPWVIDRTAPVVANRVANPVPLNTAGTLTATVTDPNGANGAAPSGIAGGTYTVDSGAPAPLTPQAGASFGGPSVPVTATLPAFSTTGVHTICVTAQDAAGNPSATQCALLAVYDPNAGFVTGGGWINSPAGACLLTTACQGASGRADFGFVSKYQKGATVPTGQTEFQFKAGNLNFHSTSYDWLVIGGAKAQYKGSGTINGAGSYSFMLTAIDGDLLGGGTPDKFRIKIWDTASGATVYDNQMGATDSADPTTAIAGGSIVIHKS
jgi:hypothetical protein